MYKIIRTLCFLFLILFLPLAHAQTQVVAKVSFVRGDQVTAEHSKETARPLSQGSEIYLGDTIKTSERSFVIIEFIDGAKMTVRPNSLFSINQYDNQSISKGALMVLHQGGVHATTGEIAKQQPEKFQIKTDTMMVKAQPADYSVQLCEHNCKQNEGSKEVVAARIVELKGAVSAKNETSPMRALSLGDALYSTDIVSSQADSYALLVFADGEKITLQAGSQLHIKQYSYHSDIQQDRALFSLIKGGMRVLTGLIGKENPAAYNVGTPVATIGIRGTGFDLFCTGDCVAKNNADMKAIQQGLAEGLYCYVWQGEINLYNKSGNLLLATSNSAYIGSSTSELLTLSQPPEILLHSPAPRPDGHNVDLKQLFPTKTSRTMPTGL
ncbi:MAG: FecR domain-containing protein, partial [Methylococcaceae bacterium]